MATLGLTKETIYVAEKVKSPAARLRWAMEELNVNQTTIRMAQRIKELGLTTSALQILGLPREKYDKWMSFEGLSKVDKILSLVEKDSSIRGFFNRTYVHFQKYRAKHGTKWRVKECKEHLLRIKHIAEECLTRDGFITEEQAHEIAMRIFMARDVSSSQKAMAA